MRVTKLTHSCLLVEQDSFSVLFDPGVWSFGSDFDFGSITQLDAIAITHSHKDHCAPDFIKDLLTQFPVAKIIANNEVIESLKQGGIAADFLPSLPNLTPFNAPHAALPAGSVPANNGYHFGEWLSHPGDSLEFDTTKPVLALPYVAPWGSAAQAVDVVRRLKPQKVLPVHDWHLSEQGRAWYADWLSKVLAEEEIEFVNLMDRQAVEL